ncbi:uncharacterized protein PgNI_12074 [Pyricularia grisea]|uniref:Uncharacterized protein n=1 Tax=Pyricularia grisea TaxID=148305 RepID=A0A6P8AQE2_PYRGI|nr:uncharacterized protein PgNI_12074 [Pyricularia grisea]TLD04290.1 hypothetical protein PgNI_12074 [Pyricularia grisea]
MNVVGGRGRPYPSGFVARRGACTGSRAGLPAGYAGTKRACELMVDATLHRQCRGAMFRAMAVRLGPDRDAAEERPWRKIITLLGRKLVREGECSVLFGEWVQRVREFGSEAAILRYVLVDLLEANSEHISCGGMAALRRAIRDST